MALAIAEHIQTDGIVEKDFTISDFAACGSTFPELQLNVTRGRDYYRNQVFGLEALALPTYSKQVQPLKP